MDNNHAMNFDNDGDGINDSYLMSVDSDGDGINDTDMIFLDSNGDGIFDMQVSNMDVDGDGLIETYTQYDTNEDGYTDTAEISKDMNQDGIIDVNTKLFDYDQNGVFDFEASDIDNNGDKVIDVHYEQQQLDTDGNGVIDTVIFGTDNNIDGVFDTINSFKVENHNGILELVPIEVSPNTESQDPSSEYDIIPNFDANNPNLNPDAIVGEPGEDMTHWECQGNTNRCALYSQMFAIEELTDCDLNMDDFAQIAKENGWFTEEGGTLLTDMNKMLDYYHVDNDMKLNGTMEDIVNCLNQGGKVIVGVDGNEIIDPNHDSSSFAPNDPNHAIEVIGVDYSDPDNPMVIINDSGHPDGCGEMVPVDQFVNAWEDSQYQIITAY